LGESRKSGRKTRISLFDSYVSHFGLCVSLADSDILSLIHLFLSFIYVSLLKKYPARTPFFGVGAGGRDGEEERQGGAGLKWVFHPSRLTNLRARFTDETGAKQNGENAEGRGGFSEIA